MSNLLPQPLQERNRREYRLRFATVSLWVLSGVTVLAIVFLVPSFILSSAKELNAKQEQALFKTRVDLAPTESVFGQIQSVNAQIALLSKDRSDRISTIIEESILTTKSQSVQLSEIRFERKPNNVREISVRGTARTREALQGFMQALEATNTFVSVDLPLSNFVERSNIPFLIVLVLK